MRRPMRSAHSIVGYFAKWLQGCRKIELLGYSTTGDCCNRELVTLTHQRGETPMRRSKYMARVIGSAAIVAALAGSASAQETVKIGLITPMTGPLATNGRQIVAGAQLYIRQNGSTVAGKQIELVVRDDGGAPETSVRLAQ